MKNPNGFGCIKHLSGSRRNPWAFVVTEGGKGTISTWSTKQQAFPIALTTVLGVLVSGNQSSAKGKLNESYGIGAHNITTTGFTVVNESEVSEVFWSSYSYVAIGY